MAELALTSQGPVPGSIPSQVSKKRKHNGDADSKPPLKKKRSRKPQQDDDAYLDLEKGINIEIGSFDTHLLADYVAQRTKRFQPDLSLVELEDRHISETAFVDTSEWKTPRTLENLPDYLRKYGLNLKRAVAPTIASKKPGCPHTLIITAAGLRAANATRVLRTFQTKNAIVAKLFAKHIKLNDAIEYVKTTRMGIGVGTPARIIDLLDAGALLTENLERIVVDFSHIDQKKRGILDMKETQQPLMQLLNRGEFKNRYSGGHEGLNLFFY